MSRSAGLSFRPAQLGAQAEFVKEGKQRVVGGQDAVVELVPVEGAEVMRAGQPAQGWLVLDNGGFHAGFLEVVSGRQAGNPAAYDANVHDSSVPSLARCDERYTDTNNSNGHPAVSVNFFAEEYHRQKTDQDVPDAYQRIGVGKIHPL